MSSEDLPLMKIGKQRFASALRDPVQIILLTVATVASRQMPRTMNCRMAC